MFDERQTHAIAPGMQVRADNADQLGGFVLAPLPGSERQGTIWRQLVPDHVIDQGDLIHESAHGLQFPGEKMQADPRAERERQQGQSTDSPGELDMARAEELPALVIPEIMSGVRCEPEPAHGIEDRQVITAERRHRLLERRRPDGVALCYHRCESAQQQVREAHRASGRPAGGHGDLGQSHVVGQPAHE